MSTFAWADSDKSVLVRMDPESHSYIPALDGNPEYAAFLASGESAADYVPPAPAEPPAPLSAAEKLAAAGLTVDELKALLAG